MRAEIIAVGSELLSPWRNDTNSLFITSELNRIGIRVWRKTIVGDRMEDLKQALSSALAQADVVLCTGGLGPTRDDITREAVAEVLGSKLLLDEDVLRKLEARFARIGVTMTPNNRQQAMVPEGAEVLPNPRGTAPGLFLRAAANSLLFLLPGPPHELKPMVTEHVLGIITRQKKVSPLMYRHLRVASEGESRVDFLVAPIYQEYSQVETTILAGAGIVDLFFYCLGADDSDSAARVLDELTIRAKDALGESVFAEKDQTLESVVGELLRGHGKTLATAESCTGGFIGKLLTDVPGSSDYYLGGMITYSDRTKASWLGVDPKLVAAFGAVSPQVAEAMAARVREIAQSDLALSVTGIAGPSGGTPEKPVGLVYAGLADANGVEVRKLNLPGDRDIIRLRSARIVLDWLRRRLL